MANESSTKKVRGAERETQVDDFRNLGLANMHSIGQVVNDAFQLELTSDYLRLSLLDGVIYSVSEFAKMGRPTLEGHVVDGVVPQESVSDRLLQIVRYAPQQIDILEEIFREDKVYTILVKR